MYFYIIHVKIKVGIGMKGNTHFNIGIAIGAIAVAHYPFTFSSVCTYFGVATLSALIADLDGTSILNRKIRKIARWVHILFMCLGVIFSAIVLYQYIMKQFMSGKMIIITMGMLLFGFGVKQDIFRNIIINFIGGIMIICGLTMNWKWMVGLGVFISWVTWLNHRGLSHTIWAALLWTMIGWSLEQQIQTEGIMWVSLWGYISHLLADMWTPRGVKILYPVIKRTFKL